MTEKSNLLLQLAEPFYSKVFETLKNSAGQNQAEAYLVGGAVRDLIMGRPASDLDFVVFGCRYDEYARAVAKQIRSRTVSFKDNIRIPYGRGRYIDISAPRGKSIEEDLLKRDFTINNLAVSLDKRLIGDPSDIEKRVIAPVYKEVFDDDPLRILRGFRLAVILGFDVSNEFAALVAEKAPLLASVAGERILGELSRFCDADNCDKHILDMMNQLGVYRVLSGQDADTEVISHFLNADSGINSEEKLILMLASLFADNLTCLEKYKPSRAVLKLVTELVKKANLYALTMQSGSKDAISRNVWENREIFTILALYAKARFSIGDNAENAGLSAYQVIKEADTRQIGGNDIKSLMAESGKQIPIGPWMAEMIDKLNYGLVFSVYKTRAEALEQARRELSGG